MSLQSLEVCWTGSGCSCRCLEAFSLLSRCVCDPFGSSCQPGAVFMRGLVGGSNVLPRATLHCRAYVVSRFPTRCLTHPQRLQAPACFGIGCTQHPDWVDSVITCAALFCPQDSNTQHHWGCHDPLLAMRIAQQDDRADLLGAVPCHLWLLLVLEIWRVLTYSASSVYFVSLHWGVFHSHSGCCMQSCSVCFKGLLCLLQAVKYMADVRLVCQL